MLAGSVWPGVGIALTAGLAEKQLSLLESCGFLRLLLFGCERLLFGCLILSSFCGLGGAGASSVTCLGHVTGLGILLDLRREQLCMLAMAEPTGHQRVGPAPGTAHSPGEPLHPRHLQPLLSLRGLQQLRRCLPCPSSSTSLHAQSFSSLAVLVAALSTTNLLFTH